MGALDGKVAVITGGTSGIGVATAERFVKEGAYVFITGRRKTELDKAVSLIGKNVTAVQGDVTSLDDLDRVASTVRTEKGVVDIIVSNAGLTEQARSTHSRRSILTRHSTSTPARPSSLCRNCCR